MEVKINICLICQNKYLNMKRYYCFILLLICVQHLSAQNIASNCADGTKKALQDFKNGEYVLEALGQIVDEEFYPFYIDFVNKKYKIKLVYYDCVRFPCNDCYHKKMRENLFKKFGDNIVTKMKEEAIAEFKKTKQYLNEIQPKIDTGFIFSNSHTPAKFSEDEMALKTFLRENIKDTKISYWSQTISFIVEKDGSMTDITFHKTPTEEVKNEVLRLVNLMPKWIPATYYGEKVRSKKSFSIGSKKQIEMMENSRNRKQKNH